MQTPIKNFVSEQQKTIKGKIWIVLVGINQYIDPALSDLEFCANDCQHLAKAFEVVTKNFEDQEIIALHDLDSTSQLLPTRKNVFASITKFASAKPEDTIVFYFSGHGKIDPNDDSPVLCLADRELTIDELLVVLNTSVAKHKLVLLDACHSGGMTFSPSHKIINKVEQQKQQDSNLYAIVSCKEKQRSWEISSLKHGVFTYCLIKGLEGRATDNKGYITADGLYYYIRKQIQKYLEYAKKGQFISKEKGGVLNALPAKNIPTNLQQAEIPDEAVQTPRRNVQDGDEIIIGIAKPIPREALAVESLSNSKNIIRFLNLLKKECGFEIDWCIPEWKNRGTIEEKVTSFLTSDLSETSLLYLAGEVKQNDRNGFDIQLQENFSLSFETLRIHLEKSTIEKTVIILNLWGKSNFEEFEAALPCFYGKYCLLVSYAQNHSSNNILTELVKILESEAISDSELQLVSLIEKLTILNSKKDIVFRDFIFKLSPVDIILPKILRKENVKPFVLEHCPYKGLRAFTPDDAHFFHGVEDLSNKIITKLQSNSFVTVVGASGSGKSSVVQAGVIPELKLEGLYHFQSKQYQSCKSWVMRPGDNPLIALAKTLALNTLNELEDILLLKTDYLVAWLNKQPQEISVLVIDQFEELFTLAEPQKCHNFIQFIFEAIEKTENRFKVIITLRADFFNEYLNQSVLAPAIGKDEVVVTVKSDNLSEEQYRNIIIEPAQQVGVQVEEGFVDVLLEQLKLESLQESRLPILQYVLQELWYKRQNPETITLDDFKSHVSNIGKFISQQADNIYNSLSKHEQECTKFIFVSLVYLGVKDKNSKNTRRQLLISDLNNNIYEDVFESSLQAFINARLLVIDSQRKKENTLEIAHEILIHNWKTLQLWTEESREKYCLITELKQKANEWEKTDDSIKDDFLLSEGSLSKYNNLYINYADELSPQIHNFFSLSLEKQERLAKAEAVRRQAESKQKTKINKANRKTIKTLIGSLCIAVGLTGLASWQFRKAFIYEINNTNDSIKKDFQDSLQWGSLYNTLKLLNKVQNKSFFVDTKTKLKVLGNTQNIFYGIREFNRLYVDDSSTDNYEYVTFSPDGQTIASVQENGVEMNSLNKDYPMKGAKFKKTIQLWNRDGTLRHNLEGHPDTIWHILFSPDGEILASASQDNTIKLWNTNGKLVSTLDGHSDRVNHLAFSPDGEILASASQDNTIKLWNTKGELVSTLSDHSDSVNHLAFSPDGEILASASQDNTIKLWNTKGELVSTLDGHTKSVIHLAFSPDGEILASSSQDNTIKLWNTRGETSLTLNHDFGGIFVNENHLKMYHLSFSPDSEVITSGSSKGYISLWKSKESLVPALNDHTDKIIDVEFTPDSQIIASASRDNTIKLWNTNGELTTTISKHTNKITDIKFSPDGKTLASASEDETINLFNLKGKLIHTLHDHKNGVNYITFNHDGTILASADVDNIIKLWSKEGTLLNTFSGHTKIGTYIQTNSIFDIAISQDKKIVAAADVNGIIKLWSKEEKLLATLNDVSISDDSIFNYSLGESSRLIEGINEIQIKNKKGRDILTIKVPSLRAPSYHTLNEKFSLATAINSLDTEIALSENIYPNRDGVPFFTIDAHSEDIYDAVTDYRFKNLVVSPDGKTVAQIIGRQIILWDLDLDSNLTRGCNWLENYGGKVVNTYMKNHNLDRQDINAKQTLAILFAGLRLFYFCL